MMRGRMERIAIAVDKRPPAGLFQTEGDLNQ